MQPTRAQPDADAIVHKNLHPIGPALGKQVGVVGAWRRTPSRPSPAPFGPRSMSIGSVASQTVDANQGSHSHSLAAHDDADSAGQCTTAVAPPLLGPVLPHETS